MNNGQDTDTATPFASTKEIGNQAKLQDLYNTSPLGDDLFHNLLLYMNRQSLMRMFFFKELYEKIIDVHGVIMEFGCKWGKNLSLFTALRGIYEPYNHNRTVLGFDTFEGLKGVSDQDGSSEHISDGFYSTSEDYEEHLKQVLHCLEQECPIPHIPKHQIIKGDVRETLKDYLANNPQTVIAFAYFDMDIYAPTKAALEMILPHITKGTIIGFDEMNWSEMPGPTMALKEVLGLSKYKIMRSPLQPIPGYIIIE